MGKSGILTSKITEYLTDYAETEDWTFLKANTQYLTHGMHPYPARMIPQVARKLIDTYVVDNKDVCIDPYCGSGTVLVESKLKGITSIGIDLNPLSILISKVKTTLIQPDKLYEQGKKILKNIEFDYTNKKATSLPKIKNIEYWFKPEVSRVLSIIRKNIDNIDNNDISDFLKVCFSLTVRIVSNTRNDEFKLFRIPDYKLKNYNPNVIDTFTNIVNTNMKLMNDFSKLIKKSPKTFVLKGDTRKLSDINKDIIHDECATILVTSPPYGDSRTTVAYGQYSRYSAAWLGFDENEVWQVDNCVLGGKKYPNFENLESPTLDTIIGKISDIDENRAKDVYSFFKDIDLCFSQISKIMKKNKSHICYVLGNRTVKRFQIPSDIILIELGKKYEFSHITTKQRNIPNKHMPSENAPENIEFIKGKTMSKENIIIWKY